MTEGHRTNQKPLSQYPISNIIDVLAACPVYDEDELAKTNDDGTPKYSPRNMGGKRLTAQQQYAADFGIETNNLPNVPQGVKNKLRESGDLIVVEVPGDRAPKKMHFRRDNDKLNRSRRIKDEENDVSTRIQRQKEELLDNDE